MITTFPFVLIPTLLVPVALLLHALALKRIVGAQGGRVPQSAADGDEYIAGLL
ncbi:MAG TPA: hypothetical protein VFI52_07965 [Gemmatimonadaceae bacterium]|nr:hypothetical protein [Gemmatimonadaceae bacterium]